MDYPFAFGQHLFTRRSDLESLLGLIWRLRLAFEWHLRSLEIMFSLRLRWPISKDRQLSRQQLYKEPAIPAMGIYLGLIHIQNSRKCLCVCISLCSVLYVCNVCM